MTLEQFKKLSGWEREEKFNLLSVADQLAIVRAADAWELILCGYPTEERILARATCHVGKGGSNENPVMH